MFSYAGRRRLFRVASPNFDVFRATRLSPPDRARMNATLLYGSSGQFRFVVSAIEGLTQFQEPSVTSIN
ncbi:MAG: hypothetical protein ACK517_00360 [bacterium]